MGVAIVAIPKQDDPVWDLSSEKIPHMTLLYVSDSLEVTDAVAGYVQHVADDFHRFGLSVDRRGTLGPEDADVYFFDPNFGPVKQLRDLRSYLLKNDAIGAAYSEQEQYPEWTPHLTLGYPQSPAHKDERDYPINWVEFDRLAIWTGDFEGPEFVLPRQNDMAMDVAMSDRADNFLAHYGVKGMRWGRTTKKSVIPSKDHKEAAKLKSKKLPELSNQDLKTLTNRQNLERQYKQLNPSKIKKGQLAVGAIIGAPATAVGIYNLVQSPAGKAAIKVGQKFVKNGMSEVYKYRAAVGITKAITRG